MGVYSYFWSNRLFNSSKQISFGIALMASAIASYLGVRFFDFYVIGKFSIMEGDKAMNVSIIVFIMGIVLVLYHLVTKKVISK